MHNVDHTASSASPFAARFAHLVARLVANRELALAVLRIVLVVGSYVGALIAADQGQIIAPRPFFRAMGMLMFIELVPAIIIVDRRLEFVGWHQAVQRAARIVCTYLFLPLRVGMWLSPFVSAFYSPMLLLITVPMVAWGEWLLRELGSSPGRS